MLDFFKMNSRAAVIKTAWSWHRNRHEEPQIQIPEINPHSHHRQMFNMWTKIQGELTVSSMNIAGKVESMCTWVWKQTPALHITHTHRKIHSKWIKDLNLGPDTIKHWFPSQAQKLHRKDPRSTSNKHKNKQVGLQQAKKLLCCKRSCQLSAEAALKMEENTCKLNNQQRINIQDL